MTASASPAPVSAAGAPLTLGFDADDTLWHNETLFAAAHQKFHAILAAHHDPQTVERALYATELRNLPLYGYGAKGFTLSAEIQDPRNFLFDHSTWEFPGDRFDLPDIPAEPVRLTVRTADGLGGMAPLSTWPVAVPRPAPLLVRPLLDVSREALVRYLRDRRAPSRFDATNAEPVFFRNRVRPVLRA